jgi:hypothetical protein
MQFAKFFVREMNEPQYCSSKIKHFAKYKIQTIVEPLVSRSRGDIAYRCCIETKDHICCRK